MIKQHFTAKELMSNESPVIITGKFDIVGELPKPYFENNFYRVFKKNYTLGEKEKYYVFLVIFKNNQLAITKMIGHNVEDNFETLLDLYVDKSYDSKSYVMITENSVIQIINKNELIPVKEFCDKYKHCINFNQLKEELKKDGYSYIALNNVSYAF